MLNAEESIIEEPCAIVPHAGICAGGIRQLISLPRLSYNLRLIKPRSVLSYTSPLIKMVREGTHKNVKIEGEDLRRLMAWVDANCVYRGDEEIRMIPDPSEPEFERFAVKPTIKNAPIIDRLQPVTDEME